MLVNRQGEQASRVQSITHHIPRVLVRFFLVSLLSSPPQCSSTLISAQFSRLPTSFCSLPCPPILNPATFTISRQTSGNRSILLFPCAFYGSSIACFFICRVQNSVLYQSSTVCFSLRRHFLARYPSCSQLVAPDYFALVHSSSAQLMIGTKRRTSRCSSPLATVRQPEPERTP